MRNLKCLLLFDLKKLGSIDFLSGLTGLRALEILDAKNVTDLSPMTPLASLEELKIGSHGVRLSKPHGVQTLQPLGNLKSLKYLWLFVMSSDNSLRGLADLGKLKQLQINGYYPWQKYAKLSACLQKNGIDVVAKQGAWASSFEMQEVSR